MTFQIFAARIQNWLGLLGMRAKFELSADRARWTLKPNVVELVPIDATHSRVMVYANGELLHASEPGPQTDLGALEYVLPAGNVSFHESWFRSVRLRYAPLSEQRTVLGKE